MGILGRYDDRADKLVPPARNAAGGRWRYDESSDESGSDDSSAEEGSQWLGGEFNSEKIWTSWIMHCLGTSFVTSWTP